MKWLRVKSLATCPRQLGRGQSHTHPALLQSLVLCPSYWPILLASQGCLGTMWASTSGMGVPPVNSRGSMELNQKDHKGMSYWDQIFQKIIFLQVPELRGLAVGQPWSMGCYIGCLCVTLCCDLPNRQPHWHLLLFSTSHLSCPSHLSCSVKRSLLCFSILITAFLSLKFRVSVIILFVHFPVPIFPLLRYHHSITIWQQ
jgi:hypothetical protein